MTREEYLESLLKAYDEGRISEDAYDAAVINASIMSEDAFCDDEE